MVEATELQTPTLIDVLVLTHDEHPVINGYLDRINLTLRTRCRQKRSQRGDAFRFCLVGLPRGALRYGAWFQQDDLSVQHEHVVQNLYSCSAVATHMFAGFALSMRYERLSNISNTIASAICLILAGTVAYPAV